MVLARQPRTNIMAIADLFEITDLIAYGNTLKKSGCNFCKEMQEYVTNPI